MGIRQPHPVEDTVLPVTHVYRHPGGKGLGAHHAAADPDLPPLVTRPAHPGAPPDWPRASLTMHDLDMHDGTELSHVATDEEHGGALIMAWTDAQGDPRMTSFPPDLAAELLEAPPAAPAEIAAPAAEGAAE